MRTSLIGFTCLCLPLVLAVGCKGDDAPGDGGSSTDTETGEGDQGDGDGDPGDGDGDGDGEGDGDGDGDGDGEGCTPGEVLCVEGVAQICDEGGMVSEQSCDDVCVDGLGCALCVPGSAECEGDTASVCADDGMSWEQSYCDPLQGLSCEAGGCAGACAEITGGFLGCDFYPTVTANYWLGQDFQLGVVVANGNDSGTNVCITQGAGDNCIEESFVGPNTVGTFLLPDVPELKVGTPDGLEEPSVLLEDAAYRVRTDLPVGVYQFNPGTVSGASADASLLFPARTWGTDYIVVSRNHWTSGGSGEFPGFYAVVGREQDTTVTLAPSSTGGVVGAGGGVAADGTGELTVHQADVLEVFTWREDGGDPMVAVPSDLTGTRITSDKPIQVIGGHKCTNVPFNVIFCDHLEDAIVPVELASDTYIVSAPVKPMVDGGELARRMVRIVAVEDDTVVSYNPAHPGAPTSIEYAGDYIEFDTTGAFTINANKTVLVAEYMTGASFGGGGDPAMALAMPTSSYLSEYLIYAPTHYNENWVNVIFDKDSVIELDGTVTIDANGAEQLGVSDWRLARVPLSNEGDGTHTLELVGEGMPFGASVYGYGFNVSYWYPGGLDLPSR